MSTYIHYPNGSQIALYATAANFPVSAPEGSFALAEDTNTLYVYDSSIPGWVAIASPGASSGIDGLTGDVSASGPGVVPATVNSVGGASAASIAAAAAGFGSATSSDTPNTLVLRNGSGSFEAGSVTALTKVSGSDAASGNLNLSSTSNATKGNVQLVDGSTLLVDIDSLNPFPTGDTGVPLILSSSSNANGGIVLAATGPQPGGLAQIASFVSEGSYASPSQLVNGDLAFSIFNLAWDGSGNFLHNLGVVSSYQVLAAENHTPTAQGTNLVLTINQLGTTVALNNSFNADGSINLGNGVTGSTKIDLVWDTDASGDIGRHGTGTPANRPANVFSKTMVQAGDFLNVSIAGSISAGRSSTPNWVLMGFLDSAGSAGSDRYSLSWSDNSTHTHGWVTEAANPNITYYWDGHTTHGTAQDYLVSFDINGNVSLLSDIGALSLNGSIKSAAAQTTLTGSVGTALVSQPFQGSSFKKVIAYLNGYTDSSTQIYTYPTAFSHAPAIVYATGGVVVTATTTTVTFTSVTTTGFVVLEGY